MFHKFISNQFSAYKKSFDYFSRHPECLINIEEFVMKEMGHFIDLHLPEIIRDYNEASYLHPFWKNYPPLERGRQPVGDQFPWIEIGEQVFGNKLARHFAANFSVKDSGLPSGSDDRCVIASERIKEILHITDSVWVFVDIKSAGPRDDFNHAVMSPYQISGSGKWVEADKGIVNDPIMARGKRVKHRFYCSLSPIYVLSDGTIAPLVTFVIKPVYDMLYNEDGGQTIGQPLKKIKVASIPNGILLTTNPNLNRQFPNLFFPGKDDQGKDRRKCRARVDFDILADIAQWRVSEIDIRRGWVR